jgi:hypothetical protein
VTGEHQPEVAVVVHPRRRFDGFISSAQKLGCRVVVIPREDESSDWDLGEQSTNVVIAHWSGPIGGTEFVEFLSDVIGRFRASGIFGMHEASLPAVSRAAAMHQLPGLSVRVISRLRDKGAMRSALVRSGLPSPRYCSGPAGEALLAEAKSLDLPVVVKPSNGFSSTGVELVVDHDELAHAIVRSAAAMTDLGPSTEVVVEEFIAGPEFAVEAMTFAGASRILSIGYKGQPQGPFFEESIYQIPSGLDLKSENDIRRVVLEAHRALDIDSGPTHTELRLDADGTPHILEIGARIGGSGVSAALVSAATGIDFFAEVLAAATGRRPSVFDHETTSVVQAAGNYIVPCRGSGVIQEIRGLDLVSQRSAVLDVVQMMWPGDVILPYPAFSGYPAFVLSAHADLGELRDFHHQLDADISVVYA